LVSAVETILQQFEHDLMSVLFTYPSKSSTATARTPMRTYSADVAGENELRRPAAASEKGRPRLNAAGRQRLFCAGGVLRRSFARHRPTNRVTELAAHLRLREWRCRRVGEHQEHT
jgi:hypothetical protein